MAGRWRTGGGGFLNDVTGVITRLVFEAKEWPITKGPRKGETYHTLSAELNVRQDGATADVKQFVPCGFFYPENQSISEDATTLISENDSPVIAGDSEFAKLVDSGIDAGIPEAAIDPNFLNFSGLTGRRVTFGRIVDEAKTKEFGKRKAKKGKHAGKEFNRDFLVIKAYLGDVDLKTIKAGKATGAVAPKAAAKTGAKASTKAPVAAAEPDDDAADNLVISAIGAAKDGSIPVAKLNQALTRQSLMPTYKDMEGSARQALVKFASSEGYVDGAKERGVLAVDDEGNLSIAA